MKTKQFHLTEFKVFYGSLKMDTVFRSLLLFSLGEKYLLKKGRNLKLECHFLEIKTNINLLLGITHGLDCD